MHDIDDIPIIRTWREACAHEFTSPALVELPGEWVQLAVFLRDHRTSPDAEGAMARAVEALLVGVIERESSLVLMGLAHATAAAAPWVRAPEEVLEQAVAEEGERGDRPARASLTLLRGGWEDPPIVETIGVEDEDDSRWALRTCFGEGSSSPHPGGFPCLGPSSEHSFS
jgi:hypothetical protein